MQETLTEASLTRLMQGKVVVRAAFWQRCNLADRGEVSDFMEFQILTADYDETSGTWQGSRHQFSSSFAHKRNSQLVRPLSGGTDLQQGPEGRFFPSLAPVLVEWAGGLVCNYPWAWRWSADAVVCREDMGGRTMHKLNPFDPFFLPYYGRVLEGLRRERPYREIMVKRLETYIKAQCQKWDEIFGR